MSISDASTASREFPASVAAFSSKWIKGTKYWQATYMVFFVVFVGVALLTVVGTAFGVHVRIPKPSAALVYSVLGAMMAFGVALGAYLYWRSRRQYVISVAGDRLTINPRGDQYSLVDAELGLWVNQGVALHLGAGGRRFLLGGEDRRIGPATPLDAPPVPLVDASLSASDFDELLALGGRSAALGPAPGEPIRCLLFPNPLLIQAAGRSHCGRNNE